MHNAIRCIVTSSSVLDRIVNIKWSVRYASWSLISHEIFSFSKSAQKRLDRIMPLLFKWAMYCQVSMTV